MKVEPSYVKDIVDLYSNGVEQKEITERTGQTYCVVRYWLKKKGLYDPNRRAHNIESAQSTRVTSQKQEAENRLTQFFLDKGFSYISGYDGKYSTLQIACQKCGEIFSQYYDPKYLLKREQIKCPHCTQKLRDAKQAEKEARHQQREQQQEERRQNKIGKTSKRLDELHTCPICKRFFSIREYAESIGTDPIFISTVEYCSKKCRNKAVRMSSRSHNHIKRAIKHGCEWEKGVTLTKLIKRDGLRCAICGEMCDLNDRSYGNGNGPRYPSLDHIIPIAKGGSHTWKNVQVAHIICNTLKKDKIV